MKKETSIDPQARLKSRLDTAVRGLKALADGLLTSTTLAADLIKIREARVYIDSLKAQLAEAK